MKRFVTEVVFLLLVFFIAFSFNKMAQASTSEYFPLFQNDGDKYTITVKNTIKGSGDASIVFNITSYHWVNGTKNISGLQCKKLYSSIDNFQNYTDITYFAVVGNEFRSYQSENLNLLIIRHGMTG